MCNSIFDFTTFMYVKGHLYIIDVVRYNLEENIVL